MITKLQYCDEIVSIAKKALAESSATGRDVSEVIHKTVDGHSWIIYCRHNLAVLQYSDHESAAEDFGGGLEEVLRSRGVSGLLTYLACAAMIRDVEEAAFNLEDEEEG